VIPPGQVSNGIVHQIDVFLTMAKFVGAEVPKDRVIDGVDQTSFFTGRNKKSARESMVIYVGNELFGAKWRNWNILIKGMEEETYAIKNMVYPSIYNLVVDPKEEAPELNYLSDTWVDYLLYQVIEDHQQSIAEDADAPDQGDF